MFRSASASVYICGLLLKQSQGENSISLVSPNMRTADTRTNNGMFYGVLPRKVSVQYSDAFIRNCFAKLWWLIGC